MKIGFFTDTYFPQINGVTYTVSLWKRELEKLGHEVIVYYPEDKRYKPGKGEIPMKSFPFPFYKGYNIGLPSMKRVEKGFDIIHLHGVISMAMFGLGVSRKQRIPCIITYHTPVDYYVHQISSNELVAESLKVIYYRYEKELLERCKVITAPSEEVIKVLKARWGDKICDAEYFSNGIDTSLIKYTDPAKFKKDYGIPSGKIIGFTGRHSTEKHLEDLIALADGFEGTVVIAGDGQQHKEYLEMAKGKKNVMFLGFLPRERMPEFYSCLDVFVMPSTAETEGLVVLEANACGVPTIGADALALKTTITEGVNGYRYAPGDIKDLKKKTELAYKNLTKLKEGSIKSAQEKSVATTAKRLESLYARLIGSGPKKSKGAMKLVRIRKRSKKESIQSQKK